MKNMEKKQKMVLKHPALVGVINTNRVKVKRRSTMMASVSVSRKEYKIIQNMIPVLCLNQK